MKLTEHKDAIAELLDLAERRRDLELRVLREEAKKGVDEMRTVLAREREERRREVRELDWPRVMEELAVCKNWVNVELEIIQSKGPQKTAWERIKEASRATHLNLVGVRGFSDDIRAHVSTMTHLTSIGLYNSAGFSAEGIKHLYRLPQLELLSLGGTDVSNSTLEVICSLTSLKHLDLLGTKVTDAGLPHLTGLPSLNNRGLSCCEGVTDAGLVHVGRLTGLESLSTWQHTRRHMAAHMPCVQVASHLIAGRAKCRRTELALLSPKCNVNISYLPLPPPRSSVCLYLLHTLPLTSLPFPHQQHQQRLRGGGEEAAGAAGTAGAGRWYVRWTEEGNVLTFESTQKSAGMCGGQRRAMC
ncbi:unnamed protein product [Closterium sp. Yama58-4]|nr:unnamed protein product [Closterium sp. Yama58-4]